MVRMSAAEDGDVPPRRNVRIGFFQLPGYHEQSPEGTRSGYGYELVQRLALYAGWNCEYVGHEWSLAEAYEKLLNGEVDVLTGSLWDAERQKAVDYSSLPVGQTHTTLSVRRGDLRLQTGDFENWRGLRVGFLNSSAQKELFREYAAGNGIEYSPVYFDSIEEMRDALLKTKSIDVIVSTRLRFSEGEKVCASFSSRPLYAIVRKGNAQLLDEMNRGLRALETFSPGYQTNLMQKYFAASISEPAVFSAAERAFLKKCRREGRVFRAIVNPDREPLSYWKNGRMTGVFVDIARLLAARAGLNLEILPLRTRQEYREQLTRNDVDLVIDFPDDPGRAAELNFVLTQPYYQLYFSWLRRKDTAPPFQSVATPRTSATWQNLYALPADLKLTFYDSIADVVDAVRTGRQDAAFLFSRSAENAVNRDPENILAVDLVTRRRGLALGIRSDEDPRLPVILDKLIAGLREEDIARIRAGYLATQRPTRSFWEYLRLHPTVAYGIPGGIVFLICILLGSLLWMKRQAYREAQIIQKLPIRYFVADRDGNILARSQAATFPLDAHGRPIGHVGGFATATFYPLMRQTIQTVFDTGESRAVNFEYEGKKRSAEVTRLPFSFFHRETVLWVSQNTDELQNMRDIAAMNAAQFQLIFQTIGDGILVIEPDLRISLVNPAAAGLLNVTDEHLTGELFYSKFHFDGDRQTSDPLAKLMKGTRDEVPFRHLWLYCPDELRRCLSGTVSKLRGSQGEPRGVVMVFQDVTDEYAQQRLISQNMTMLEKASSMANLAYYRCNERGICMASFGNVDFWPSRNGVSVDYRECVIPEDQEHFIAAWHTLLEGKVDDFCVTYRSDSWGERRYFEMRVVRHANMIDGVKSDCGLLCIVQEITDSKRREEQLIRLNRERRRAMEQLAASQVEQVMILNTLDIPVLLFDRNRVVLHVNAAARNLAGEVGMANSAVSEVYLRNEVTAKLLTLAYETRAHQQQEMQFAGREFLLRIDPVCNAAGEFHRLLCSYIDVTEFNHQKRQVIEALESARSANRAKSLFIASVSHEIRTPLNAVIGFADLLRDGRVEPELQKEYLNSIANAGNTLLELINDVLDLSKLESDRVELKPVSCDCKALCEEVVSIFKLRAAEKHLALRLTVEDLPLVRIDKLRLRQILFNLLSNAVKFTDTGSVELQLSFTPENAKEGTLHFTVKDTGIGISAADREHLMQPFYQASPVRGTRLGNAGSGLGLAISRRLVEKMKGSLELQSEPGRGSVFHVTLPQIRYESAPVKSADGGKVTTETARLSLTALRVLLVDDVAMNLVVLKAMFNRLGILDVTTASGGAEALALFQQRKFDLVMTDLWMPDMNGKVLADEMRKLDSEVRIFAVTADSEADNNFNMDAFEGTVCKPVSLERIREVLAAKREPEK